MRNTCIWLLCVIVAFALVGCGATEKPKEPVKVVKPQPQPDLTEKVGPGAAVATTREEPLWVQQIGRWEEEYQDKNPKRAAQYMFIVGISDPVESIAFASHAGELASQNAVFQLQRAMGMDFVHKATTGTTWMTTPDGDTVKAIFRKAMDREFSAQKLNLREYAKWGVVAKSQRYIVRILFRLNRDLYAAQMKKVGNEFAKEIEKRKDLNKQVRAVAMQASQQIVADAEKQEARALEALKAK